MRKSIDLFFLLLIVSQASYCQNNDTKTDTIRSDLKNVVGSIGYGIRNNSDSNLKIYADSISNYPIDKNLPYFLFDECFDYKKRELWNGFHSPVSVRWKILRKVNSRKALKIILALKDKRLDQKCGRYQEDYYIIKAPLIEKTFRQLILKDITN